MIRTVHSELIKIRTTRIWWLVVLGSVAVSALALLANILIAHFTKLDQPHRSTADLASIATSLYTSGQFLGLLLVMLTGAVIVTSEYAHRTATGTFLATPRRSTVVGAKTIAAGVLAAAAWLLTTTINVVAGSVYLRSEHASTGLGRSEIGRAILLNLAAYLLWAMVGVGLGVLLRSQIGSVLTGTAGYLLGFASAGAVFGLIHSYLIKQDWVLTAQVIVPATATSVMTNQGGAMFHHAPSPWVGAAVLTGYGVLATVVGTLLIRRQDVSS
jgi:ABC-type transport system involved in multi-copper enzyme maturation permease subunit